MKLIVNTQHLLEKIIISHIQSHIIWYLNIDFVTKDLRLYRFIFEAGIRNDNGYNESNVSIIIKSVRINKNDSYEICEAKLDSDIKCEYTTYDKRSW